MKDLLNYRKNVYSQNGEDGVIEEILKRLEINDSGTFCEFGAWDGIYLSNTYNLINKGWKGVCIEGDEEKYKDLLKTSEKHKPNIVPMNKFVDIQGENSLDIILKDTFLPKDFDVLSIDVDSFDYHIWNSLNNYFPKIVIIEVDSSVLPPKETIHTVIDKKVTVQGSSYTSTFKLALQKGYLPVCFIGNMVSVRQDLVKDLFEQAQFTKPYWP
jgi:hypothetical protein